MQAYVNRKIIQKGLLTDFLAKNIISSVGKTLTRKRSPCLGRGDQDVSGERKERDRGVEPLSQPWEGWARPIYQSRQFLHFALRIGVRLGKPGPAVPQCRTLGTII